MYQRFFPYERIFKNMKIIEAINLNGATFIKSLYNIINREHTFFHASRKRNVPVECIDA
jgi:hypothetical protein